MQESLQLDASVDGVCWLSIQTNRFPINGASCSYALASCDVSGKPRTEILGTVS